MKLICVILQATFLLQASREDVLLVLPMQEQICPVDQQQQS